MAFGAQAIAQVLPGLQTPPPAPAPPASPAQQAAAVGLGQCSPLIDQMVADSVDGRTDHTSGWSRDNPNKHVFQSVIAMNHPGTPPDALAAVIAAPVATGGCDGASVRIFPLGADCPSVQQAVQNGGQFMAMLLNTRIMLDANNKRLFLLPGANNTCIAVAVDSYISGGN